VSEAQTVNHNANFKERNFNSNGLQIKYAKKGALDKSPFAKLTHAEKAGWGPEELVVRKTRPGTYVLYVQRLGEQLTALEGSGAKVHVYQNNHLVDIIYVKNEGKSMTKGFWKVLEFEGKVRSEDDLTRAVFQSKVVNMVLMTEPPEDPFS